MPQVFTSFVPEESDTKETRMRKLYLGIVSTEEQLYSFNAAISEMRKKIEELDKSLKSLKEEYKSLKNEQPR